MLLPVAVLIVIVTRVILENIGAIPATTTMLLGTEFVINGDTKVPVRVLPGATE